MFNKEAIQASLKSAGLDGWLLYDAHGLNPIARQIVAPQGVTTRRFFVMIPSQGPARILYHRIEQLGFRHLEGEHRLYGAWKELDEGLKWVLGGCRRVAMEYSPDNAIPYVARVDAGTIEKIRALGVEVVSSADLIARFLAAWTPEQVETHKRAVTALMEIKDAAFRLVAERVRAGKTVTELEVATSMRDDMTRRGMVNDGEGPICAVDANAGNPHYEPTATMNATIGPNQVVLLDLWAKLDTPDAVYGDITWVGYTGAEVPKEVATVVGTVARARNRAIEFLTERYAQGQTVHGFEVDREVRKVIVDAGYGDAFTHRTGHSIGRSVHDVGPNIDDLETQDRRVLQSGVAFSIEPGIYLPKFGIRLEIDVLVTDKGPVVTTLPLQQEILRLT
jgi:Xaa-Pro aminopeptidase